MRSPAYAADHLLIVHPDSVCAAQVARIAHGLGCDVRRATSPAEAEMTLRAAPEMATVLVAHPWPSARDERAAPPDQAAPVVDVVTAVRRVPGQRQVVVLLEPGATREECWAMIRAGVDGFVPAAGGNIDVELLQAQIARARQRSAQGAAGESGFVRDDVFETTGFVGCSRVMGHVLRKAVRAAGVSDVPVLVYGESGTGKELLAQAIHRLDDKRSKHRMIAVNCAAITGSLADSALFGHLKGAFTGATENRLGHFRSADGGTVLLDEIGELDLQLQPKLLRVLQEGLVLPVGSDEEKPVDVRVVAATNRRLEPLVESGAFRLDLFQRLNVITIEIPPLRNRPEDIPLLVRYFLKRYAAYYPRPITDVDPGVFDLLAGRRLRGNVREVENVIRRVLALKTDGDRITVADLAAVLQNDAEPLKGPPPLIARELVDGACKIIGTHHATFSELIDECERLLLARAIEESERTQTDLARVLGVSRRTLYNKRRKHRL